MSTSPQLQVAATPNAVDRLIGYFSPEKALRRLRARAGVSVALRVLGGGGYVAGRTDDNALQEYNPVSGSADADINPGLDKIRARSRDQIRNNPLASGAVSTVVTSTVGTGLAVQPRVDRRALGVPDEVADDFERGALRVFEAWAETTECDLEDERNFYQLQDLVLRSILADGDVLRLRRFLWDSGRSVPARGGIFGTKVQLVEADRVSNPHFRHDTERMSGGVEVDGDGRPIRYHVQATHPGSPWGFRRDHRWLSLPVRAPNGQRVAQLLYHKLRVGQRRGVPYLAPVILKLKQLERYTDAELMAAVLNSFFTVFLKSESGGAVDALGAVVPNKDALTGAEEDQDLSQSRELKLGTGVIMDLDPGDDPVFADPKRPNDSFDPFVTSVLRQIGVALELPFEILVKHFQSSYSASRGALLEAWKFYRVRRQFLVGDLCQPCYEDVISEAVARGILEAPGFFDSPFVRRAWLGAAWAGDAMPQIDPLREVGAAKIRVDEGFSTRDRESMEMNGSDFESNHQQRTKEERMRREDGLVGAPNPGATLDRMDTADQEEAGSSVDRLLATMMEEPVS